MVEPSALVSVTMVCPGIDDGCRMELLAPLLFVLVLGTAWKLLEELVVGADITGKLLEELL